MLIRVEQGKGRKDRYTILSPRLLDELRQYWKSCRPKHWLLPGHDPDHPIHKSAAQRVYNQARQRAGIQKGRGILAPHLLELGVDLPTIQALMATPQ
jgi:integrase/recombinase XerD